jgi:hypothetical protein
MPEAPTAITDLSGNSKAGDVAGVKKKSLGAREKCRRYRKRPYEYVSPDTVPSYAGWNARKHRCSSVVENPRK